MLSDFALRSRSKATIWLSRSADWQRRYRASELIQSRRTLMKRGLIATTLVAILLTGFSLNPAAPARAFGAGGGCSNASAAGNWGYTFTGTLFPATGAVQVAAVGKFTQDAAGNFVGNHSRNAG